jgi:hypothetical protein
MEPPEEMGGHYRERRRRAVLRGTIGFRSMQPGRRWRLQWEDGLLALWIVALERGMQWLVGSDPSRWLLTVDGAAGGGSVVETAVGLALSQNPFVVSRWFAALGPLTMIGWLTIAGLALVIFTRGREDVTVDEGLARRMLVTGPFYYVLALAVAMFSSVRSGAGAVAGEPPYPGILTPPWLRRAAVVPAALLGQSAFRDHTQAFLMPQVDQGAMAFALQTLLLLAGFVLLVAGPRIAAGSSRSPKDWVAPFLVFIGAVLLAQRFA